MTHNQLKYRAAQFPNFIEVGWKYIPSCFCRLEAEARGAVRRWIVKVCTEVLLNGKCLQQRAITYAIFRTLEEVGLFGKIMAVRKAREKGRWNPPAREK